jgi:serine protease Do
VWIFEKVRNLLAISEELADLVASVLPSIVSISGRGEGFSGSGSGFVFNEHGRILTNHHVIDALADPIEVTFSDGSRAQGRVIGSDRMTDLAILQLTEPRGDFLRLRERPARAGELCLAIGSPLGLFPKSVSLGVISGVGRTDKGVDGQRIEQALQTDAAINPGNSGGPLLDMVGHVMGVTRSGVSAAAGISFAIPAETVGWISEELMKSGRVKRASLGVSLNRVPTMSSNGPAMCLVISRVNPPAKGRLREGDVLLDFNGAHIGDVRDLDRMLVQVAGQSEVELSVRRNDSVLRLSVPLSLREGD